MKIAIANQKGGVGKTTTAINLGECLAVAGRRTIIVDLDPQGNATTGLGLAKDPQRGLGRLLRGDPVSDCLSTVRGDLRACIGSPSLVRYESEGKMPGGHRSVSEVLDLLAAESDVVLVDCPPALGRLTREALSWSRLAIIPLQCEFFAMEGLAEILGVLEQIRDRSEDKSGESRILPTMFDASLPFHREVLADLRNSLGSKLLRTVIPRDVTLAESSSHGVPVLEYDCLSRATHGYVQLCREVLEHGGEATR